MTQIYVVMVKRMSFFIFKSFDFKLAKLVTIETQLTVWVNVCIKNVLK